MAGAPKLSMGKLKVNDFLSGLCLGAFKTLAELLSSGGAKWTLFFDLQLTTNA